MELTKEKVGEILTKASEKGLSLKVRDISYVLLTRYFADKSYAYRVCFGADADYSDEAINAYEEGDGYAFLREELATVRDMGNVTYDEDITFEENKAYMLKLKKDTEDAIAKGEVDKKDGLKILADLSVKLNDRFQVNAEVKDQIVQLTQKYSSVCEWCGRECAPAPMTKEQAMKEYNLVEK